MYEKRLEILYSQGWTSGVKLCFDLYLNINLNGFFDEKNNIKDLTDCENYLSMVEKNKSWRCGVRGGMELENFQII